MPLLLEKISNDACPSTSPEGQGEPRNREVARQETESTELAYTNRRENAFETENRAIIGVDQGSFLEAIGHSTAASL